MLADADPTAPWWVAVALGVTTVIFAALRLYDYFKVRQIEWDKGRQGLDKESRQELTEEQRAARRDSETEAWRVVDRQNAVIESHKSEMNKILADHATKIKDIETRERECTEERAENMIVLQILVAWANKQRNPPPIPEDVLARLVGGSGSHIPLTGGAK